MPIGNRIGENVSKKTEIQKADMIFVPEEPKYSLEDIILPNNVKEQILDIMNFFYKYGCRYEILTWNKTNPTPMTNNTFLPDIEYCLYFRETGVRLNDGYELKSKWYEGPINKKDKDKYKHPTIKPLELVKRHILHTTQKDDIILDCFSGSGTTCVAAKELDRRFIGIEIDPEYHKISINRLNGILANGQISFDTDITKLGGTND